MPGVVANIVATGQASAVRSPIGGGLRASKSEPSRGERRASREGEIDPGVCSGTRTVNVELNDKQREALRFEMTPGADGD